MDTLIVLFQVDLFEIEAVDLLDVKKFIIGHNETRKGKGWYLDEVLIKAPISTNDSNTNSSNNQIQYKEYKIPCKS